MRFSLAPLLAVALAPACATAAPTDGTCPPGTVPRLVEHKPCVTVVPGQLGPLKLPRLEACFSYRKLTCVPLQIPQSPRK